MNDEDLKRLVAQGMHALRSGCDVALRAQEDMAGAASHEDLRSALKSGQEVTRGWIERLDEALSAMPGDGPGDNPVQEAIFEEERRIRDGAPDEYSRDLGIIAAGQQALHYWMASFGTMAAYAKRLGMDDVAADMHACVEDAERGDEKHNELAAAIL